MLFISLEETNHQLQIDIVAYVIMQAIAKPIESLVTSPSSGLGKGSARGSKGPQVDIIDIRQGTVEFNLKEEINRLFRPQEGPRKLPTLLLYDEKGLQLFEEVKQPSV